MATFAAQSLFDRLELRDPGGVVVLEVQKPNAVPLVDGRKTGETRRYELPTFASNGVEVVIMETDDEPGLSMLGEAPDEGAGRLVGVVTFEFCRRYESEGEWRRDSDRHLVARDDAAFAWDGTPMFAWAVKSARQFDPSEPSPPLARRHRGFYDPQTSSGASRRGFLRLVSPRLEDPPPKREAIFQLAKDMATLAGDAAASDDPKKAKRVFTIVAGDHCAQIDVDAVRGLPRAPCHGGHAGRVGASIGGLIALCPSMFLSLALTCKGAIFTGDMGMKTEPLSHVSLMKGVLVHSEADGVTPLEAGGPLCLNFPLEVDVKTTRDGLRDVSRDLPDAFLLELRPLLLPTVEQARSALPAPPPT